MGNNASVKRFRTDMQDLWNKTSMDMHQDLLAQGDELVGNIQAAIEHSESGHLRASVRKRDVSSQDGAKISVLIAAGGPMTVRRTSAGAAYDYALAEEFGTVKETPRPFFYNTVRRYRSLDRLRETFEETLAENNKVRGLRGDNYTNTGLSVAGFKQTTTISRGYRGAVVVKGKI